jgi:hypothetical protein
MGAKPCAGMAMLPKRGVDVRGIEVARFMTATQSSVERLSFFQPRSGDLANLFQDDIYVDCKNGKNT